MAIFVIVKRVLQRLDHLVPVLEQHGADEVDGDAAEGENPIGPVHAQSFHDAARHQIVCQATEAGSGRGDSHSQAPATGEPLGQDRGGRDVQKAHGPAETNALAEEKVPYLRRVRGTKQRAEEQGRADEKRDSSAAVSGRSGDEGRTEK